MSARMLIHDTVSWLREREVPTEVLAESGLTRGVLGLGRRPTLVPVARVWRLGVLLIAEDGRAWATGSITRKTDPKHANYQSVSGERRRDVRRLVWESPAFAVGESVDYDADPLDLDDSAIARGTGPLREEDGVVSVEWAPGGRRLPLERYLRERRELLLPRDGWTG